MRDFLPDDVRRREHVVRVIRDIYERHGFEPLETPAVENIETLLGKYGEEGNKLIFKILKRGEHEASGQADLALRYDLTVPLARVVAEYHARLPRLFKRYQIQPVWRADRPARGRFREFYQCDADALGSTSTLVEVDVLAAVSEVLERLGFEQFSIRLNHRRLLTALLERAGIPPALHPGALVALDKWDKVGRAGVADELRARGVTEPSAAGLLEFFESAANIAGDADGDVAARPRMFAAIDSFLGEQAAGREAASNLREICELAGATAAGRRIGVDPSLARGLSYYTGAIMEIAVPDLAGSLGGGGRYDNLVGMFSGREVPACGFSLGLERIIVVMTERAMFPESVRSAPAQVLVALFSPEQGRDAIALGGELRAAGMSVEVYPDADKLGKQFKYAAERHVPFVVVVGDDERARGLVTVKDLRDGQQVTVERASAAATIAARLAGDVGVAAVVPAPS